MHSSRSNSSGGGSLGSSRSREARENLFGPTPSIPTSARHRDQDAMPYQQKEPMYTGEAKQRELLRAPTHVTDQEKASPESMAPLELEHVVGLNMNDPEKIAALSSDRSPGNSHGSALGGSGANGNKNAASLTSSMNTMQLHPLDDQVYIAAMGANVVLGNLSDPHDQTFMKGHDAAVTRLCVSKSGVLVASTQAPSKQQAVR